MRCPIDDIPLAISDRQGIEIDYCPECRGVWLDRGELDKLIERSAAFPEPPPAPERRPSRPAVDDDDDGSPGPVASGQEVEELVPERDLRDGGLRCSSRPDRGTPVDRGPAGGHPAAPQRPAGSRRPPRHALRRGGGPAQPRARAARGHGPDPAAGGAGRDRRRGPGPATRSLCSPVPTTGPPPVSRSRWRTGWSSTTPSPPGTSSGPGSVRPRTWPWSWPTPAPVSSWVRVGCCGRWRIAGSRCWGTGPTAGPSAVGATTRASSASSAGPD